MADFSGYQLTKKGLALQAKAQSGVALQYTKISVGDGIVPSGTSIESLTNLISPQMNVSPIAAEAVGDGTARVRATLSNAELESGFILREIGVFAKDPDVGEILYAYTTAGSSGDPIPAGGGTTAIERVVEAVIIVGQATNIQFQVKSGTYITIDELQKYTSLSQFEAHVNDFSDHIKVNRVRQNSEAVQVGDIRYPGVLSAVSYLLLECTAAGTTGTIEPTWGAAGSTVTDGTAKWIVCDIRDTSVGTSQGRRVVLGSDSLIDTDLLPVDVVKKSDFTYGGSGSSRWEKNNITGTIKQWCVKTTDSDGIARVTFPTAFPNAVESIVVTHAGGETAGIVILSDYTIKQGCSIRVRNTTNGTSVGGWYVYIQAIGR